MHNLLIKRKKNTDTIVILKKIILQPYKRIVASIHWYQRFEDYITKGVKVISIITFINHNCSIFHFYNTRGYNLKSIFDLIRSFQLHLKMRFQFLHQFISFFSHAPQRNWIKDYIFWFCGELFLQKKRILILFLCWKKLYKSHCLNYFIDRLILIRIFAASLWD